MNHRRTVRLEARVTPVTAVRIQSLARLWSKADPLSRADVVIEAVRRAWEAEAGREEHAKAPPGARV